MSEQNSEVAAFTEVVAELLVTDSQFLPVARLIGDLTEEQATARPDGAPYSIGQLTAHLHYWLARETGHAQGEALPPEPDDLEATFPAPVPGDWYKLRDGLIAGVAEAAHAAQGASEPYGLAEAALHNAYHLGQIALLRRILGIWPPVGGEE